MNNKVIKRKIRHFLTGIFFGSIISGGYILTGLFSTQLSITKMLCVAFFSGCIGLLTAIFDLDMNFSLLVVIHCLLTFGLLSLMFTFNGWFYIIEKNPLKFLIGFLLSYGAVWAYDRIKQRRKVRKINEKLANRKGNEL